MGLFTADKPKFKKLKEDGCAVNVSIEIPAQAYEEEVQNRLVRLQQRASVPGFRAGKAPLAVIQKHFSGHAREDAFDALARKFVPEALRELALNPISSPVVQDISQKEGKPITLTLLVEVAPKVSPKDYVKIPVTKKKHAPNDEDMAKRLEELREGGARLEASPEEAVGPSHYVVVDYAASRNGKPLPNYKGQAELVDMASEQTIDGLTAGLEGMKRNETKEIAVKVDGQDASLSVTLKEIKTKVLPALDADFAKDMGFDSLDLLKAKLREVMEKEGEVNSERDVTRQIEEALLKANTFPLPPSLVESQLEHDLERLRRRLLGGNGRWPQNRMDELKEKLRPQSEDTLRMSYLLTEIAAKEKITPTDADLEAELERNLADAQTDKEKDEIRKLFEERRDAVSQMIRDRKTMSWLREKAAVKEA